MIAAQTRALTGLFEMASTETEVDQPLCLDCSRALYKELTQQLQEAEREVLAYQDALQELELQQAQLPAQQAVPASPPPSSSSATAAAAQSPATPPVRSLPGFPASPRPSAAAASPRPSLEAGRGVPDGPGPSRTLEAELEALRVEEARELERIHELEVEYELSLKELRGMEEESARLDLLEEGYWKALNRREGRPCAPHLGWGPDQVGRGADQLKSPQPGRCRRSAASGSSGRCRGTSRSATRCWPVWTGPSCSWIPFGALTFLTTCFASGLTVHLAPSAVSVSVGHHR